jgi:hypothetical protein
MRIPFSGGAMSQSRRQIFTVFLGAAGFLAATPLLPGLGPQRAPQPVPSPNAPNPNFPPGLNGPDIAPPSDKKSVDPAKQQTLRADIQKLFELASGLRDQVMKSDLNATMPISVIKEAQQIEKLAKQIKELAKG